MGQSFIPFPTAMMGELASNPLAVSALGAVMAFNTVLFIVLHAYILRRLIRPEAVETVIPGILRKSFVGVLSYAIGAAAAWATVYAAFAVYLLTPLFFLVPPTRRGAARSGRAEPAR